MSKIRTVVFDDQPQDRKQILQKILEVCFAPKEVKTEWYSLYSFKSWDAGEVASGISPDSILEIKPHILIFDLRLKKEHEYDFMDWARGLQVLDTLYSLQPVGSPRMLPQYPILISNAFNTKEPPPDFTKAKDGLDEAHNIKIHFFDWDLVVPRGSSDRNEFQACLFKAARDAVVQYSEEW